MNRQKARKVNEKSREIREEKQKKRNTIIISQTTWNRVNSEQQYQQEDIVAVASCLLDEHGYDIRQQLKVLSGEGQLKLWLKGVKNFDVHQNAYFCVYNIQGNDWVVFSLLAFETGIVVLYKDTRGGEIVPEIRETITDKYSKHNVVFKSNPEKSGKGAGCGPMCLKNLETILEGLNELKGKFIKNFERIGFCTSQDVEKIREKLQAKLLPYLKDNILHSIVEMAQEPKFISSMNEFIDLYVHQYVGIGAISWNYCNVLQEEFAKKEEDPNYCINEERVKDAKDNFFGNDSVKELINKRLSGASCDSESKPMENDLKHKIEKDFPDQTKTFIELFSWINNFKDDEQKEQLLQQICEKLGLEYEMIKEFYEIGRLRTGSSTKDPGNKDSPKVRNVEELEKDLPPMEGIEGVREPGSKTTEELLQELCLGPTWSAGSWNQSDRSLDETLGSGDGRVSTLWRSLCRLREARDRRWRTASLREVRVWARGLRLRSPRADVSATDVEETLAVVSRAHELVTGGQQLRDTQLIAALVCLLGKKGNLCQMATGEGKTAAVSVLAAAEVLLHNRQVDIVTTNQVLAHEGFASRRSFFELLGVSVSCNAAAPVNRDRQRQQRSQADDDGDGARACYAADVVYGDMATFQFDHLRHSCERQGTRGSRSFGRVIVDEVDSMLIDNAGRIAKLASPFPGMDSLRYVHIKLWQEASKAVDDIGDSIETKLKEKAQEIEKQRKTFEQQLQKEVNDCALREGVGQQELLNAKGEELNSARNDFDKLCETEYEKYRNKVYKEEIDGIKSRIKKSKPSQIDLIPAHLRPYASLMEDEWIDNVLYAMFECCENEQYVLRTDVDSGETVAIPVDYSNTGVTLRNTQWSNGLHQFVQLKHNLRVTQESLTSSFVSNVGYIKLYGGKVWGLTGTLGSDAETQLLSDTYDVSHAKIPTFKPKVFIEFGGIVVENSRWANVVALDAILHTRRQRSVLVICKTIKDVHYLEKQIKNLVKMEKQNDTKIKTYADENSSEIVKEVVGPGEIIVATNIAGRGTDLRTSETLEERGGLHVCVTFLPANQRVEDQAFGRTSRQGNVGSAQIILCRSDVLELGLDITPAMDFSSIKLKRDELEETRISEAQKVDLQDIQFYDAIFNKFSDIYVSLREGAEENQESRFVAMDLKEKWAFWLHRKDFKKNRATRNTVDVEFLDFLENAKTILGDKVNGKFLGGQIALNPYYSIQQAELFFNAKMMKDSEKALLHAIQMDSTNSDILHSAYLKLFEIEIEKGRQLWERFRKAMLEAAGIDIANVARFKENEDDGKLKGVMKRFANFFSTEKDEAYKQRAMVCLEKAKVALEKEKSYIKINFFGDKTESQDNGNKSGDSSQANTKKLPSNQDFINILISNDNPLVKQITSRYTILNTFYEHVQSLLIQIEESLKKDGLAVVTRIPNYLKTENFTAESNSAEMLDADLSEVGRLGLETIYALRKVHDVPKQVIRRAQAQIAAGVAAAGSGALFPPALIVAGPLASALISEGICDIVLELMSQGSSEFSEAVYVQGKLVSYAVSLVTLGLGVLSQCVALLDEAIKCCRSLARVLRESTRFQRVCKAVANIVEKIGKYFKKLKYFAQMEKLNRVGNAVSKMNLFTSVMKGSAKGTLKRAVGLMITEKLVNKSLDSMLNGIKPEIKKSVKETVESRVKEKDLEHIKAEDLQQLTNDILLGSYGEIACDVLKEVAFGLLSQCNSWKVKIGSLLTYSVVSGKKIYQYSTDFCEKLKIQLKKIRTGENKPNNKDACKKLQEYLISTVTEKMYSMIMQIAGKHADTLVVNPVVNRVWNFFDPSEKKRKQGEEELNKKFNEISEAYEKLGLDFGATDEQIKKAYRSFALKHHPDSRSRDRSKTKEENSQIFMNMTEARDLLYDYNKMQAAYEALRISREPVHVGNIETLSSEHQQHIVILNENTGETSEFGEEHRNNGRPTINLWYTPPSQVGDGHYRDPNFTGRINTSGENNCFYDAYASACESNGIQMSPDRAREAAEKPSWSNLAYDSMNALSELLNNPLTKELYMRARTALLVGGRDPGGIRQLEKGELYPYEKKPNANLKEEKKIKKVLAETINYLTERNEKYQNFNPNRAVGNRLKSMGNIVPAFGSVEDKDRFMLAVLYVKYNDNTELRIITSSGSDIFHDRQKVYFDRMDQPEVMRLQKEGYDYHDPGDVRKKKIFDLHNMEEVKGTFNKSCAAQKAFYVAGEETKAKVKKNHYLKVEEVIMRECWFKKGLTKRLTPSDIRYIASCGRCEEVLPKVTGLPPRNPKPE